MANNVSIFADTTCIASGFESIKEVKEYLDNNTGELQDCGINNMDTLIIVDFDMLETKFVRVEYPVLVNYLE